MGFRENLAEELADRIYGKQIHPMEPNVPQSLIDCRVGPAQPVRAAMLAKGMTCRLSASVYICVKIPLRERIMRCKLKPRAASLPVRK